MAVNVTPGRSILSHNNNNSVNQHNNSTTCHNTTTNTTTNNTLVNNTNNTSTVVTNTSYTHLPAPSHHHHHPMCSNSRLDKIKVSFIILIFYCTEWARKSVWGQKKNICIRSSPLAYLILIDIIFGNCSFSEACQKVSLFFKYQ